LSSTSEWLAPPGAALVTAGAGAVLVLVRLAGTPGAVIGLAAIVAGTVLAAPYADRRAAIDGWWNLLALGALTVLAGTPLELVSDTVGGLMTALGAIIAAVAVALGLPGGGDEPRS
jgi:hypothetical protein